MVAVLKAQGRLAGSHVQSETPQAGSRCDLEENTKCSPRLGQEMEAGVRRVSQEPPHEGWGPLRAACGSNRFKFLLQISKIQTVRNLMELITWFHPPDIAMRETRDGIGESID